MNTFISKYNDITDSLYVYVDTSNLGRVLMKPEFSTTRCYIFVTKIVVRQTMCKQL